MLYQMFWANYNKPILHGKNSFILIGGSSDEILTTLGSGVFVAKLYSGSPGAGLTALPSKDCTPTSAFIHLYVIPSP